jgi:hypothetical protein
MKEVEDHMVLGLSFSRICRRMTQSKQKSSQSLEVTE